MVGAVTIGVLALQGDFEAHARALDAAGAEVRLVKVPAELEGLAGLILPGGESTTMLKLMATVGMEDAVRRFHEGGGALFGTCAGLILLARGVTNPAQRSLGLLDVTVERNAYGRQVDSFETKVEGLGPLEGESLPAVFIRAPRIERVGPGVEVLARHGGTAVLVRNGRVLAASFHPELTRDPRVHGLFCEMAGRRQVPDRSRRALR